MGGNNDKIEDSKTDATVITDDDKIDDSKNDATIMADDDKIDDIKNDASTMADDDKIHDMDVNHGVIKETDHDGSMKIPENNDEEDYTGDEKHQQLPTPNALMTFSNAKAEDHCAETPKNELEDTQMDEGYESGTAEEQETFMREVDAVYKEKNMDFKPPKFYGQPLNCLKLWRSVIKVGGYDRVTRAKWGRQAGEAFHPSKTCTTVSWTFHQFYEKALLEYERHKVQTREIDFPLATVFPEVPTVDNEVNGHQTPGSGSGRARRDAAARAMQGWHAQRLLGFGGEGNSNTKSKVSLVGPVLHPFLERAYVDVLSNFFVEKLLCSQQLLSDERYEKILEMVPEESIVAELRGKWEENRRSSSGRDVNVVRWEQLKHLCGKHYFQDSDVFCF